MKRYRRFPRRIMPAGIFSSSVSWFIAVVLFTGRGMHGVGEIHRGCSCRAGRWVVEGRPWRGGCQWLSSLPWPALCVSYQPLAFTAHPAALRLGPFAILMNLPISGCSSNDLGDFARLILWINLHCMLPFIYWIYLGWNLVWKIAQVVGKRVECGFLELKGLPCAYHPILKCK